MIQLHYGFYGVIIVKNLPANAGDAKDMSLIPRSGRSPGEGNGNPLQYSCLDRKSTRLNSSHSGQSRMPSSA